MRWLGLLVRVVRAPLAGVLVALVAMLAFSVLEAIGATIAERSVQNDDPNPFTVPLLPIGVYSGIAAGIAALTWPAPRRPLWYGSALAVRALSLAALVGFVTSRLADLVVAVEPVLAWILAALVLVLVPALAWETRPVAVPRDAQPTVPPLVAPKPTMPTKPAKPSQSSTSRDSTRRR